MTSSLVGSEMCIRDRPYLVQFLGRNNLGAFASFPDAVTERLNPWLGSVSYTHLTLPTICSV
eukprot:1175179-Prorocentrum_lima.AAC.1